MAVEFSMLMALAALAVLVPVVGQLRGLAPRVAALREELEAAPLTRELRYTIREVVVIRDDPKVVALPLRQSRLARPEPRPALQHAA